MSEFLLLFSLEKIELLMVYLLFGWISYDKLILGNAFFEFFALNNVWYILLYLLFEILGNLPEIVDKKYFFLFLWIEHVEKVEIFFSENFSIFDKEFELMINFSLKFLIWFGLKFNFLIENENKSNNFLFIKYKLNIYIIFYLK